MIQLNFRIYFIVTGLLFSHFSNGVSGQIPTPTLHYDFEAIEEGVVRNLAQADRPGTLVALNSENAVQKSNLPTGDSTVLYFDPTLAPEQVARIESGLNPSDVGIYDSEYTMTAWVKPTEFDWADPQNTKVNEWYKSQRIRAIVGQPTRPDFDYNLGLGINFRGTPAMRHGGWTDGLHGDILEVENDAWQHISWTFTGNRSRFFLDGDEITYSGGGNPSLVPLRHDAELLIGAGHLDLPFSGFIDDLRIYDRALTLLEIQALAAGLNITGDFNRDGNLDGQDIDLLTNGALTNDLAFDLDGDADVDLEDRRVWVTELEKSFFGDANLDGEFNSSDLVSVFQFGFYETDQPAKWSQGDFTGDQLFDSSDLVLAFEDGGFEIGQRVDTISVPEPSESVMLLGLILVFNIHRRKHRISGRTVASFERYKNA